jgi:hypothetical protein
MGEKAYSVDGDVWTKEWETLTDLLMAHLKMESKSLVGLNYFEGDVVNWNVRQLVHARMDSIIDGLEEEAYEEGGEWADDWPDLSGEEKDELEDLIAGFLEKKSPCSFYHVQNVIEKIMTEDAVGGGNHGQ